MVLIALIVVSIIFQTELNGIRLELKDQKLKTETLQTTIQRHETIIQRFNTSVTNSDVLTKLNVLEHSMTVHEDELRRDLDNVKADISQQLDKTLSELGETVKMAENEIHDEVDKVKKDVESYVRTTQDQFSMENSFMVYQLAGTFTLLSCLISMWHMTAHLRRMNQPIVQRKILAILWMCPIYAVTSWFSLVFHTAEGYLAVIKDFYEAYIIYQFLSFCIAVLGRGDRSAVVDLLAEHADHLSPPMRLDGLCNPNPYESDRALADAVLLQCQGFAMQFVFLRPLTTITLFVLEKINYYGPTGNQLDYRSPQFYIIGLQNLSVFGAFTGLLKFYHAVDKDLSWCRPFAKFLCIKGVVFMTFWQGLAITLLANTTDVGGQDQEEWARAAQNFLICLEMLLFSIAHFYTFPTEEWVDGYRATHKNSQFGDSIALGDFVSDLKLLLRSNKRRSKKKKRKSTIRSVDKLPTIEDGDHDDETVFSSASFSHSEADEINLQVIEEALQSFDGSDPEVNKVKLRLLSNRLLSCDGENEIRARNDSPSDAESPIQQEKEEETTTNSTAGAADDSVTTLETGGTSTATADEMGDSEENVIIEEEEDLHIEEATGEEQQAVDHHDDDDDALVAAEEGEHERQSPLPEDPNDAPATNHYDGEISEVETDDDEDDHAPTSVISEEEQSFQVVDEVEAPPMGPYSGGLSESAVLPTPIEEEPTERTGLLLGVGGGSSVNSDNTGGQEGEIMLPGADIQTNNTSQHVLRPSIFTQISSVIQSPKDDDEDEDPEIV
mmetsp:Transcript_9407/g.13525  ORF Transcript_9407/g.13525 Transcript_9407/m.13525 type:complete len:781 (+) Transcript_9407:3-2345(+)